jgi:hypothetical protein
MSFPKEAIKEVLESLDHTDDAIWTDDGSPLVSEVQRAANDKTITRAQINDAFPGFARKTKDSVAEDVQPDKEGDLGYETGPAPRTDNIVPPDMSTPPEADELDDPTAENDRLRKLAYQRVLDAETNLSQAKEMVSVAQRNVFQAEQRHERALKLYSSKYPAISFEENIKKHLASQQAALHERVTGQRFTPNAAQNPVDQTLMDRKRDNGRKGNPQAPFLPRKAAVSY